MNTLLEAKGMIFRTFLALAFALAFTASARAASLSTSHE
jgi:hypothetical protein